MLRRLFAVLIPYSLRKSAWNWRNVWSHAFSDKLPDEWSLDSYVSYWNQRLASGNDSISYPEIIQIALNIIQPGARILDIGCGTGVFLSEVGKAKNISAVGIDVSPVAVDRARTRGIDVYVCDATKESLTKFGVFDVISCFEVLEHISNPEELLINLRKAYPNADVVVSIPNTGYIASRFRLLMGRFPKQWIVHPSEHIRFWTLQDFRFMARGIGFNILNIYPIRGFIRLAKWWPGLFAEALVFHMRPGRDRNRPSKSI